MTTRIRITLYLIALTLARCAHGGGIPSGDPRWTGCSVAQGVP